jgi:iron complex transport system substrate-binding protein
MKKKDLAIILGTVILLGFLILIRPFGKSNFRESAEIKPTNQLFSQAEKSGFVEVTDASLRKLALVTRGQKGPLGFAPSALIFVPPERVAAANGQFDAGLISSLGFADSLVGVTLPQDQWQIPAIADRMAAGKIAFLGSETALDYEKLLSLKPDLIISPGFRTGSFLESGNWPYAETYSSQNNDLLTRLKAADFWAAIYRRPEVGRRFREKLARTLMLVSQRLGSQEPAPVMWVYLTDRRFFVEPGNNWVGELAGLSGGRYLFSHIKGDSTIEVTMEHFLEQGRRARVMIIYPPAAASNLSKNSLLALNPVLEKTGPFGSLGRVYAVNPIFYQSFGELEDIVWEMAALNHPELFPEVKSRFFREIF